MDYLYYKRHGRHVVVYSDRPEILADDAGVHDRLETGHDPSPAARHPAEVLGLREGVQVKLLVAQGRIAPSWWIDADAFDHPNHREAETGTRTAFVRHVARLTGKGEH